jgi:glycosyltransferase involved in cell wall biosynthesis
MEEQDITKAGQSGESNLGPQPILSIVTIMSTEDKKEYLERFLRYLPKHELIELVLVETVKGQTEALKREVTNSRLKTASYFYTDFFNFARARNTAKNIATGKWILSLDADEILPEVYHKDLLSVIEELDKTVFNGAIVGVSSTLNNRNDNRFNRVNSESIRLFRNLKEINWIGYIHEVVDWTILPELVTETNLTILHTGYVVSKEEYLKKLDRNFRGIGMEIAFQENENIRHHYLTLMKITIDDYNQLI